jgi:AraC-like DNA-binding protein
MIRVQRLFESPFATVDRVDHPADVPHVDPPEERSDRFTINFIERGEFHVAHAGGTLTLDRDALFVTTPGQINRYSHSAGDCVPDDVVLAVGFGTVADDDVLRGAACELAARAPFVPLSNRRAYLRHRLLSHLESGADAMALDSIAGELLHATVAECGRRRFKASQVSWYAPRVDAARRLLDDDYASRHTLTALADGAGMSPFHFARVFCELAGAPPHRYLVRRRLHAAADRLRAGDSVTNACYAVGFSSLSHFIHAFRRQFGVSPSRVTGGRDTTPS